MVTKMTKILLSVAFLGACLGSIGCDESDWEHYGYGHGYGDYSYTDVGIGFGYWPAYSDYTVVEEYYPASYVENSGYYYGDGYGYDDYYGDCWDCGYKTKRADRTK